MLRLCSVPNRNTNDHNGSRQNRRVLRRVFIDSLKPNERTKKTAESTKNRKEHKQMYGNADKVRICPLFHTFVCNFFTFLNACISDKTSLINTKLGDFGNLGVLFLTIACFQTVKD